MSKSSANAEPSMEEILASIRQIISDDEPEQPADDESPEVEADAEPELESGADEVISESDLDALFADPAPAEPEPEPEDEPSDDLDDGFAAVAAEAEPEPEPEMELEEDEDVLDLASMAEPSADMSDEPFDPPEDLDFAEPEPEPEPTPEPVAAAPESEPVVHEPVAPAAPLLSQQTDSAVSSAFADLASTMLSGNARTLEDLVQ
ncbi:unnamed protein product, partial [Ectocarpus sp. 12 AP-2014]